MGAKSISLNLHFLFFLLSVRDESEFSSQCVMSCSFDKQLLDTHT